MNQETVPLTRSEDQLIARRLSGRPLDLADIKAQRYVGKFFNRRRIGRRIVAEVEGNHGCYVVSITVGARGIAGRCSCYVGARGDCHHVRALAQTFVEEPESFALQETRTRKQLRTLDDLEIYLESTSLEELLVELQARGLNRQRVSRLLGLGRRSLGDALRAERRNDPPETVGALKLAGLYLLEWCEAAARQDDLSEALSGRSRSELLELIGEFVGQLSPWDRSRFVARFAPRKVVLPAAGAVDGDAFLAEIDDFIAECERGVYYDWSEVAAYQASYGGYYEPDLRAFALLDGFFRRADQYHQAGEHAVAVAAYEKLFDVLSGNPREWFGFGEISGWLETDLRHVTAHYLRSLSRGCEPEEYVQRARHRIGWTHPDLLVTESAPRQLAILEADLLREIEGGAEGGDVSPYALSLLRQIYEHQGRTADSLELCRRWRHQYPALRAPLIDHAEAVGDWGQLEVLAREALSLSEGRARSIWAWDEARARLEWRLARALEQQGDLEGALAHAQLAFRSQPELEGYRRLAKLATRISRRGEAVEGIVEFLRAKLDAEESPALNRWPSREAVLLARVLLAEGRHGEAHDLAMDSRGATQAKLLNMVGSAYLESGREEALPRAAECYRRLVELYVEARGRDNYTVAATYASLMRETYRRQGRDGDFDRWYGEFMDRHHRLPALREEFRKLFGPEPRRYTQ